MVRLADILQMVAADFDLEVAELRTRNKRPDLVHARDIYTELARRFTPHALTVIARPLDRPGRRLAEAARRLPAQMKDPTFARRLAALDAKLRASFPGAEIEAPRAPRRKPPEFRPCAGHAPSPLAVRAEFFAVKHQLERIEKEYSRG